MVSCTVSTLEVVLLCSRKFKSLDRHLHRGALFCSLHKVGLGRVPSFEPVYMFLVNTLSIQLRQVGDLTLERLEEIKPWSPTLPSTALVVLNSNISITSTFQKYAFGKRSCRHLLTGSGL